MKKLLIMSVLGLSFASAQSLQDREVQAQQETALQETVVSINQRCGDANLKAGFDWAQFTSEDLKSYGVAGYCGEALLAVARTCESSEIAMETVKEKLQSVTCGKAAPRSIELNDGNLRFNIDFNESNDANFVHEFLMKNL